MCRLNIQWILFTVSLLSPPGSLNKTSVRLQLLIIVKLFNTHGILGLESCKVKGSACIYTSTCLENFMDNECFWGSFRRWILWMMRKNICWNLQNLIHRQEHFLDMYNISIISKVGHAPPLFRTNIRGSEVTHTHVHTVRLSTYNTIQYNIYVSNYEVFIRWCNILCGCIFTRCIALSTFLNEMRTW